MKRIILIKGAIETLGYFSLQLAEYFSEAGREVFVWDMQKPSASIDAFEALADPSESVLITFNFIGLGQEGQFSRGLSNIWDEYGIKKICILVDSPVYYYRQLSSELQNVRLVCIDRYHKQFIEKMYPEYGEVCFMPLGGNRELSSIFASPGVIGKDSLFYPPEREMESLEEWKDRPIDVLFAGNYVPTGSLEPALTGLGQDYRDFLMRTAQDLFDDPSAPIEETFIKRLTEEFPDCTRDEYLQACYKMVYIDLYVRSVYRAGIVAGIADRGIRVHCTGKDWDLCPCDHPENIISTGESVSSRECLEAMKLAKVSLNMMPWFKAGAHDRVFSAMLMGSCLVSDSSEYLDEIMPGAEHYMKYELTTPEESARRAADRVEELLKNMDKAYDIASSAKGFALSGHTWTERAKKVDNILQSL